MRRKDAIELLQEHVRADPDAPLSVAIRVLLAYKQELLQDLASKSSRLRKAEADRERIHSELRKAVKGR